jgi:RNA polymerase sigma factor (sigma-70 family)
VNAVGVACLRDSSTGRAPSFARSQAPAHRDSCRVLLLLELAESSRSLEQNLCEQARAGSRAALGKLLERHGPRLYRSVLLPRLGSADAAEEALAITYAKVVERFAQFEWQDVGVYPWLRMVAMRVAIDVLRARKREVLFEPSDLERELDDYPSEGVSADQIEQRDLEVARRRVVELLDQIHPRYADAIRLRVLEARTREDTARQLGVSVSTFDVVLHRALSALRKVMSRSQSEET